MKSTAIRAVLAAAVAGVALVVSCTGDVGPELSLIHI